MKKTIIAFSLVALMALPLAACGGTTTSTVKVDGETFVVTDYALDIDAISTTASVPSTTNLTMQSADFGLRPIVSGVTSHEEVVLKTNASDSTVQLYNMKTNATVMNDAHYTTVSRISGSPFLMIQTEESELAYSYYYASPTGTPIGDTAYESVRSSSGTSANGDMYYSLSYGEPQKTVYWTYDTDAEAWKEITEAEAVGKKEGEYQIGDTVGYTKYPLSRLVFGTSVEAPADYKYAGWKYSTEEGNGATTYTFYNGDEKVGSTTLLDNAGGMLGVIGKNFYYFALDIVSSDATSGYNFETSEGSATLKANVTMYQYDFTKDKLSTIDRDFMYMPSSSYSKMLYNKTEKDADKMVVSAIKKSNGVFIASEMAMNYTFIIDEDAKVSFDLTGKALGSDGKFYQLSENRFLSGSTIVDKDLNTVAPLPHTYSLSPVVWKAQNLICCGTDSSTGIFVDYDGKVVFPQLNMSGQGGISDEAVVVSVDGEYKCYNRTNPNGKAASELLEAAETDTVSIFRSMLFKKSGGDTNTFYTFGGRCLGSTTLNCSSTFEVCGKVVAYDPSDSSACVIFA